MHIDEAWFQELLASYRTPPVLYRGVPLPAFPSDEVQENTTGQAGEPTLREAFNFYSDCKHVFEQNGAPFNEQSALLDFGTGWGRIARFFLKDIPLSRIHGIDVTEVAIKSCREMFGTENFSVCPAFPPSRLPSSSFSHIVGYSVFSHLSENACLAWMQEFHRILAPGGVVSVTTRGYPFFDFCESLKGAGHDGYLGALSELFDDFDDARARYRRGEFVHSNRLGVSGGGAMNDSFYGETFIPQAYLKRYSEWFDVLEFRFIPERHTHPTLFFRRKRLV